MTLRYTNPVWPRYFADPFVLKVGDEFFAYGTSGPDETGSASQGHFPILRSQDLSSWAPAGVALTRTQGDEGLGYWAPEVAEKDGLFYMFYSRGGLAGEGHALRLAIAERPEGPFTDTERLLMPEEPFSIDGSPFRDPKDGQWYLFFAKDYFDEPVGTGLAVVQLADDLLSVQGAPIPLVRATADWQIFERNREWYGKTWPRWHTIEGPFVVERDGRYHLFYSGGLWQGPHYGVSSAVADHPLGPYVERDSTGGPTVLRGIPGAVGPGHNSIVSPDGATQLMVYHAWDDAYQARRMCIDPIAWTPDGPVVRGPTLSPQEIPLIEPAC